MRKLIFERPTALLVLLALWLGFASTPTAETRQLYVKVTGDITGDNGGTPARVKIGNATFKQGFDPSSRLVLDIGESTTVSDVVSVVTSVVDTVTNSVTNSVTNIVVSTNSVTNVVADAFTVQLLDPQGNPLGTFFEFDSITSISTKDTSDRFFGLGTQGSISNLAVFGDVSFDNAVLSGQIQFASNSNPRSVNATIRASGSSGSGDVIFNGKLVADDPFVPAPTNLNANALSK